MARSTTTLALVVIAALAPAALAAQDATRPRILIPYLTPEEGADDRFGRETAKKLRDIINSTHPIYSAIPENEIKDELKRFDLKIEELGCMQARQLASRLGAVLTLCGSYNEEPQKNFSFDSEVWDMATGERLGISPSTVAEKEYEQAATHILDELDRFVSMRRADDICAQYQQSKQWENALRQCDEALAINPSAMSVRYRRARILYEMQRLEESLEELLVVLEENPVHQDALNTAGYVATMLATTEAERDVARGYYESYLELNPANAQVRMNIAYDLATAGDPVGAMGLIQVGLDLDAENLTLWEQYGNFAFAAAEKARSSSDGEGADLSPEVAGHYRSAAEAYVRVYEGKGPETTVSQLRNVIAANLQLGDPEEAVSLAERFTQTHPDAEVLWSIYSDALRTLDRTDDAVRALDRVAELDPEYANLALRKAQLYVDAERLDDAIALIQGAVAEGRAEADGAVRILLADGVNNGYSRERWSYAIDRFRAGKRVEGLSSMLRSQLDWLHAFSLYSSAESRQAPNTLASAEAALPLFQEVVRLLGGAGEYVNSVNQGAKLTELRNAANAYIEIQQAIISRGGGVF